MRWAMAISTILLTLSAARADEVEFCFLFCTVKRPAADSFCMSYQQVNRSAQDAAAIGALPRAPKVRLTANDVLYLCRCRGWDHPVCKSGKGAN